MTPNQYRELFSSCVLTDDPQKLKILDKVGRVALANDLTYKTVARFVSVPWPVIAALHVQESSQNFTRHLHNGDPLSARTVHVPKGRPSVGEPPFTWIESATDALENVWRPRAWDIPGCLEFWERYNGLGYRKYGVRSPYLWGFTDKYTKGLFVADGHFDPEKADVGPGCVAVVKTLEKMGVSLDFTGMDAVDPSLH